MKKSALYKQAYTLALMQKQAKIPEAITRAAGKAGLTTGQVMLAAKLLGPIALAGIAGVGAGYALNRLSRRSDPSIADSNTKEDINRVERLRKIQYYNALAKQLEREGE